MDGKNKRRHLRTAFSDEEHFLIEYKKLSQGIIARKKTALTRNLSASGVLFRAPELLHTGTLLKIYLSLPSIKKPIKTTAKVVRIDSTKRTDFFDIAICFLEIAPEDQKQIDQFCKSKEEKKDHSTDPFI